MSKAIHETILLRHAPAKLNLFLEVVGRRSDGYHELVTVMVRIDLHDTLRFEDDATGQITLSCNDPSLPYDGRNLVVRAAEVLREFTGCRRGVRIALDKAIPAEAGLGGGSSDAATTLLTLKELWSLDVSQEDLETLGGRLGSDVPFFVRNCRAAVCRGRGELLEEAPMGPSPLWLVLVRPNLGMKTAEVYGALAASQHFSHPRDVAPLLAALGHNNTENNDDNRDVNVGANRNIDADATALGQQLFNRLEETACLLRPELLTTRRALAALSPPLCGALMSGSGSAFFGLASCRSAAVDAADALTSLGLDWVRVVTCGP